MMTGFIVGIVIGFATGGILVLALRGGRKSASAPTNGEDIHSLARALAHEIRNPLNTIKLNIQLLEEEHGNDRRFDRIQSEIERLERILTSFLQYTRLPTPSLEKVDLNQVVRERVEIFRPKAEEIGIEFRPGENLPRVRLDRELFSQVLQNILQNAVDASREGPIIVETGRSGKNVYVAVVDRGEGIPPELLDKVFKPYFSTKKNGVGIGMAVVKKIIEAHGGKIQIQSRTGKGTRVVIELPAA